MSNIQPFRVALHIKVIGTLASKNGIRERYKFNLPSNTTWAYVIAKFRHMIKLLPCEAIYIFIGKKQEMPRMLDTVGKYNKPNIRCSILAESTFGFV